jgi:hypothetical protein
MAQKISGYSVLHTTADVAAAPDTTLLANIAAYTPDGRSSTATDLMEASGSGGFINSSKIELIFTHSAASDADATTSVFELHGSSDSGPREPICTLALTGGKAQFAAGSDLVTWVDTAVATDLRTTGVVIDDSATDRVVRVTVDIQGLRYLEGLFTGAASTAVTATAYYRFYGE